MYALLAACGLFVARAQNWSAEDFIPQRSLQSTNMGRFHNATGLPEGSKIHLRLHLMAESLEEMLPEIEDGYQIVMYKRAGRMAMSAVPMGLARAAGVGGGAEDKVPSRRRRKPIIADKTTRPPPDGDDTPTDDDPKDLEDCPDEVSGNVKLDLPVPDNLLNISYYLPAIDLPKETAPLLVVGLDVTKGNADLIVATDTGLASFAFGDPAEKQQYETTIVVDTDGVKEVYVQVLCYSLYPYNTPPVPCKAELIWFEHTGECLPPTDEVVGVDTAVDETLVTTVPRYPGYYAAPQHS
ncbi:unnamed protein product [Vitrella brassicaformis CCMP3155]|uniref:Cadherin-like domain-containing protein n=2 Tax=Vitrella brassicaformis TaxID=1169539 RepID=A0A0G4GPL0_VITBC|nr:unnamed protein product [Vitrella brassicaformis CCMP3155]|eukprot:CEM32154.1 unnamed protein product [Vitrella brassicaformis CCMP3155]